MFGEASSHLRCITRRLLLAGAEDKLLEIPIGPG